jgi:hypothetical protein
MFNDENVRGLRTINAWAVFRVNSYDSEGITPPGSNMGGGQPLLKQREIGSVQRSE